MRALAQPASGNYNLSFGGTAAGKVDPDGAAPTSQTVSVVAGSTNTVEYIFDRPGRIQNVAFTTRDYGNVLDPMTWDSIVVDNTGMATARVFTATRALNITTPSTLFPFTSPYSVYAGTCGLNNPGTGAGLGSGTVPVGGSLNPGPTIQLPSLQVTLWSGTAPGASTQGSRVSGGDVVVRDTRPGCLVTRTLTTNTNANGQVPDDASGRPMIGLPYGNDYEVCAVNGAQNRKRVIPDFVLTSSGATGTPLDVYMGASGGTSGTGLTCP